METGKATAAVAAARSPTGTGNGAASGALRRDLERGDLDHQRGGARGRDHVTRHDRRDQERERVEAVALEVRAQLRDLGIAQRHRQVHPLERRVAVHAREQHVDRGVDRQAPVGGAEQRRVELAEDLLLNPPEAARDHLDEGLPLVGEIAVQRTCRDPCFRCDFRCLRTIEAVFGEHHLGRVEEPLVGRLGALLLEIARGPGQNHAHIYHKTEARFTLSLTANARSLNLKSVSLLPSGGPAR